MVTLDFTDELAIIIGDDFSYQFEFQDENCDPISQVGSTFEANLTKNGTVLVAFTVNVSTNVVTLSLTDAQTGALTATKNAKYRLRRTTGSQTISIVGGDVEIKA